MEFEGRITAILPAKTGTRQDGTQWIDLSFVFAYYENGEQRFEDSAIVSTFDTNIMAKIAPYVERGQDGKVIIENDVAKLKVQHIPCRCGFSHRVKIAQRRDGSGTVRINEMRCYKLEVIQPQQAAPQPPQTAIPTPPMNYQSQQAIAPQTGVFGEGGQDDDLPF
jgi:hypothetical protein